MGDRSARELYRRYSWTTRVRPMAIGATIARLLAPESRCIIETVTGFRFFADPLSNFGEELVKAGVYEPETEQILRAILKPGDNFLDVGANEGYFSVLAASIVGSNGHVTAVEPQSRLCEIIEINLGLNGCSGSVLNFAVGGLSGENCKLHLYPALNTGAASIVRKPRLYRRVEDVKFIDPVNLLNGREFFSLIKVDVEGYEGHVVRALLPLLQSGRIQNLLLDYHPSILRTSRLDPASIEKSILSAGMSLKGAPGGFSGYRLYSVSPGLLS